MNWKCPNCGYEPPVPPKPPAPPYQYNGYLKEYLPTILKLLRMKMMPGEVVTTVERIHNVELPWGASSNIIYIRKRYGIEESSKDADTEIRNREIARRYAVGDVTYAALGREFGISRDRICQIVFRAERRAEKEMEAKQAYAQAKRIEDIPLESLDLPVRALNCFKNGRWDAQSREWICDCHTVGDAMKLKDSDLLRMPNFGKTSLREWKECLERLQREWRP